MHGLKLSLEIAVLILGYAHIFVNEELVGDGKRHQELSSVGLALKVLKTAAHPPQNVLDGLLVAVNDFSTEVGVKVCGVAEYLQVATDTLLSLVLSFLLHVDVLVLLVEVGEDAVHQLEQLQRRLVVEFDHRQVLHEGWSVQLVDDLLQLASV